jgi:DNA polymerase-1
MLDDKDKLHAEFDQTGTTTGRFASRNPNLQNIPMRSVLGKKIRQAFVADDGFELVAFDYSQIELRIAAFLSNDPKLIKIFQDGGDIHRAVASQVFGVAENEVSDDLRSKAKTINFGILYGMGVNALKDALHSTREEAQKFYNDYFETFSVLAKYLDEVKRSTGELGYTETFFGRRRNFEGIKSELHYIRAMAERMAINAPIQGTEADIIKLAMSAVWDFIAAEKLQLTCKILLQVHDELVFEIQSDKVAELVPKIQKIMEEVFVKNLPENSPNQDSAKIVCVVNAESGKNWLEMEEV